MGRLIFYKFFKDFTNFFLSIILSIALIVWVIQAVNYLDLVSEDGHGFKIYFLYTLYTLPKIISRILPFIFFISIFFSLIKIEEKNELQIFWLNGIQKIDFVKFVTKFSLLYLILLAFLNIFIVPYFQDNARSFIRSSDLDYFTSLINEKKFNDSVSDLTIYIDEIDESGKYKNIYLKDNIDDLNSQIIYAKSGEIKKINNVNLFTLYDGSILNQSLKDNYKINIVNFASTEFNLSKYKTTTITTPKIQEYRTDVLLSCYFTLRENSNVDILISNKYRCKSQAIKEIKQEFLKRIITPIYIPILALISCLLLLKSKDQPGFIKQKFIVFLFSLSIVIFSEVITKYAGINNLLALIFSMSPVIIGLLTYLYLKLKIIKNVY
tara:strand:- start:4038 stop:5177 length:1140 start_codon:yes stop_codon:yes gene_type:complete